MRRGNFEVTVRQSETPLDMQLLTRLLAASAVRQHLAAAQSGPVDRDDKESLNGWDAGSPGGGGVCVRLPLRGTPVE